MVGVPAREGGGIHGHPVETPHREDTRTMNTQTEHQPWCNHDRDALSEVVVLECECGQHFDPETLAPLANTQTERPSDTETLDQLANLLSASEWNSDLMEPVFHLIRQSGREITDLDDTQTEPRYHVKKDGVGRLWGVWDRSIDNWWEGDGNVGSAEFYAGVPMWRTHAEADLVAFRLRSAD